MIYHSFLCYVGTKEEKDFLKRLGARVNSLRKEKGFSVVELADRADLTRAHVYLIQSGGTNPTATSIKRLADSLEVSVSELFIFPE